MRGQVLLCVICGLLVTFSVQGGNGTTTEGTSTSVTSPTSQTLTTTTPASNNVTTTPASNNVTTTPASNNVTTTPGNNNVTTTPANNSDLTTTSNETSSNPEASVTPNISTTANPVSCTDTPCGNNSVCLQLADKYICKCQLNSYYNEAEKSCNHGESFYGDLRVNMEYNPDTSSAQYAAIYNHVSGHFKECFINVPGYQETVILQIQLISSTAQRRKTRSTNVVSVKVAQIFTPGDITESAVSTAIQSYMDANPSFGTYTAETICDGFYCDAETTTCTMSTDGQSALCTCKDGRYSSTPVYTSCRDCEPSCGSSDGQYCEQSLSKPPKCACKAGYKLDGAKCTQCDFGFSGDNCTDKFLLILVIVGAVLGAAVIILLGAVIGVSVRSQKRKGDNEQMQLITRADKVPAEDSPVPRNLFPKVRAKPDLGQVNNVYEENESYARTVPEQDYDENPWYEMSRNNRRY